MRLALVTTYPPQRCGIGVYSQNLAGALCAADPGMGLLIAAEGGRCPPGTAASPVGVGGEGAPQGTAASPAGIEVVPAFKRSTDYVDGLVQALAERHVSIAHFQHAPDIFGEDDRILRALNQLGQIGIRTVVTLHTVNRGSRWRSVVSARHVWRSLCPGLAAREFHRELGAAADAIVVHHREHMADRLEQHGVDPKRIAVIQHGTSQLQLPEKAAARTRLGLPKDALVFLFFGFIHVQKNVHTIVEAFARIARRAPSGFLVVAGNPWADRWYNRAYCAALKARIALGGLQRRVLFRQGYIPSEQVPDVFAASDVVLLPHWQRYGSASGVFHQAIGAGRPVLLARGPKFSEAINRLAGVDGVCLPASSPAAWASAMLRMVDDPAFRGAASEAISAMARDTAWPNAAARHLAVYRGVLKQALA